MSMRTCTLLCRRRCPSPGCAPSSGTGYTALVPLRPVGRRCTLRGRELRVRQGQRESLLLLQRRPG
eukprot:7194893-Alexandrium_andersonii.AAC.1